MVDAQSATEPSLISEDLWSRKLTFELAWRTGGRPFRLGGTLVSLSPPLPVLSSRSSSLIFYSFTSSLEKVYRLKPESSLVGVECSSFPSSPIPLFSPPSLLKPYLTSSSLSLLLSSPSLRFTGVICLEEFLSGSKVARLNCLCSFHDHCLSSWLSRGRSCPVHARET